MALELWLMVILFAIGTALIVTFIKHLFKAAGFILLLFFILNLAFTFFVIADFKKVSDTWFDEPRIYVYETNGTARAAVSFTFPENESDPEMSFAGSSELEVYSKALVENNLSAIKRENYRLFLMNQESVENVIKDEVNTGSAVFSKQESIDILNSNEGFGIFIERATGITASTLTQSQKDELIEQMGINDESEFTSMFFMLSVVQSMFSEGPAGLLDSIEEFKAGNLVIYEETLFYKSFRLLPVALLRSVSAKAVDVTGNAVASVKGKIKDAVTSI